MPDVNKSSNHHHKSGGGSGSREHHHSGANKASASSSSSTNKSKPATLTDLKVQSHSWVSGESLWSEPDFYMFVNFNFIF